MTPKLILISYNDTYLFIYCIIRLCLEVYREYYILNNECRSRSFVCLPTEDRTGILLKLVRAVDTVMKSFRREEYYKVTLVCKYQLHYDRFFSCHQ